MRRYIIPQMLVAALVMALSWLQCSVRAATASRPGGICEIFVLPRGYACDERQVAGSSRIRWIRFSQLLRLDAPRRPVRCSLLHYYVVMLD